MSQSQRKPPKAVYTIIHRSDSGRKHWVRIGSAFENRDQSYNVRLDALPLDGVLQIREVAAPEITSAPGTLLPRDRAASLDAHESTSDAGSQPRTAAEHRPETAS